MTIAAPRHKHDGDAADQVVNALLELQALMPVGTGGIMDCGARREFWTAGNPPSPAFRDDRSEEVVDQLYRSRRQQAGARGDQG